MNVANTPVRFEGFGKHFFRKTFVLPALLAASIAPAAYAQTSRTHDIPKSTVVYSAADTPWINQESTQLVYDVQGDPLLSAQGRQQVEAILDQCFKDPACGQMKMVLVPQSNRQDILGLATDYYNQLKLGDAQKNDGVVVTVDVSRFRQYLSNRYAYAPGHGLKAYFQRDEVQIRSLVGERVMSLAQQASTTANKKEAQRLWDQAMTETADIFTARLRQYKTEIKQVEQDQAEAQKQAQQKREEMIFLLQMLLLFGALGGAATVVGVRQFKKYKNDQQVLAAVQKQLVAFKSSTPVTAKNLYTSSTLETLLKESAQVSVKKDEQQELVDTIQSVWDGIKRTQVPRWQQAFFKNNPDIQASATILLKQGLSHPFAEIRKKTIQSLVADGVDRRPEYDEYQAFMGLLRLERDPSVIQELVGPMLSASKQEDVALLKTPEYLNNSARGVRQLSIAVLAEYADEATLPVFLTALETETETDLIKKLTDASVNTVKKFPAKADTLVSLLKEDKPLPVLSAAVLCLGALKQDAYFAPLWQAYDRLKSASADEVFEQALGASVRESHRPELVNVLKKAGEAPRLEKMAIALLEKLPASKEDFSVLLNYLKAPDTQLPEKAINLFERAVVAEHRPVLLEELHRYKPEAVDVEPMLGVIAGIKKLRHAEDLDDLVKTLQNVKSPLVSQRLYEAAEMMNQSEDNFGFLSNLLMDETAAPAVRRTAALVLDDYGQKALAPLTMALRSCNDATVKEELSAYQSAITKIAQDDTAFDFILGRAEESHVLLRKTASDIVVGHLEKWAPKYSYDDSAKRQQLKAMKTHQNTTVAGKATAVYSEWMNKKITAITNIGSNGDIHEDDNYETLKKLKADESLDTEVRTAAENALNKLEKRLEKYRRQQRQAAADAAVTALRIASVLASSSGSSGRSSSWGSSGGGGFSSGGRGGGGFSSGGGSGW